MKHKSSRGFTLIELMIVIVVVSILTALATTSYQNSVRKARRGDAKAALMELAQLMERNYTEANRFDQNAATNNIVLGTNLGFTQSPAAGGTAYYNLQFSNGSTTSPAAQTYVLQAVPIAPQDKDTQCMTLRLSNTGAKTINGGTGTAAECWSR